MMRQEKPITMSLCLPFEAGIIEAMFSFPLHLIDCILEQHFTGTCEFACKVLLPRCPSLPFFEIIVSGTDWLYLYILSSWIRRKGLSVAWISAQKQVGRRVKGNSDSSFPKDPNWFTSLSSRVVVSQWKRKGMQLCVCVCVCVFRWHRETRSPELAVVLSCFVCFWTHDDDGRLFVLTRSTDTRFATASLWLSFSFSLFLCQMPLVRLFAPGIRLLREEEAINSFRLLLFPIHSSLWIQLVNSFPFLVPLVMEESISYHFFREKKIREKRMQADEAVASCVGRSVFHLLAIFSPLSAFHWLSERILFSH